MLKPQLFYVIAIVLLVEEIHGCNVLFMVVMYFSQN
jgi:hypothetical protein